jgi:hypothetical protein
MAIQLFYTVFINQDPVHLHPTPHSQVLQVSHNLTIYIEAINVKS